MDVQVLYNPPVKVFKGQGKFLMLGRPFPVKSRSLKETTSKRGREKLENTTKRGTGSLWMGVLEFLFL